MNLDHAIQVLSTARDRAVERLRGVSEQERQSALGEKIELDRAIGCLRLCMRYDISPTDRVSVLPEPTTLTPSSEYRIVEDHESDDRAWWTEVRIDGYPLRPVPGALIVEKSGR